MRWAEYVARIGDMKNAYEILVGKLEGKRPLGKHERIWEDNIRMDLMEIRWNFLTEFKWLRILSNCRLL
jgi:hypothetical protein